MKKVIIVLLILILVLCGCEKKEYKLIEISGMELIDNLSDEKWNFVLAIYYEDEENSEQFLKDLEKTAKRAKENIYYVDMNNLDAMSDLLIFDTLAMDMNDYYLRYIVYQDNQKIVDEKYSDYDKMYEDLNGKKYDGFDLTSEEDVEKYLSLAQEAYDDGYLATSYNSLKNIWSNDKAKKKFLELPLLNMINDWGYYKINNRSEMNFKGMFFVSLGDNVYLKDKIESLQNFKKPSLDDYESHSYRIIDNNICIGDEGTKLNTLNDCKIKYEIMAISKTEMKLKKDNEIFLFNVTEEVE